MEEKRYGKIQKSKIKTLYCEIGINHNGYYEIAKKLILQSKKAGADAVKFQKGCRRLSKL